MTLYRMRLIREPRGSRAKAPTKLSRVISVIDQFISSGSNLLATLFVARYLSAGALGMFALMVAGYHIANGLQRALLLEPYLSASADRTAVARSCLTLSAMFSLLVGLLAAAAGSGLQTPSVVILGVAYPILACADTIRHIGFGLFRPGDALLCDVAWLLTTALALLLVWPETLGGVVGAWVGGALCGFALSFARSRVLPGRLRSSLDWWTSVRGFAVPLAASALLGAAATHGLIFVASLAIPLDALGQLRAAQLLFAPALLAVTGVALILLPSAASRTTDQSDSGGKHASRLAVVALAVCVPVLVLWPVLSRAVLPTAPPPSEVGAALALSVVVTALGQGALVRLKVHRRGGDILRAQAVATGAGVLGMVAIAPMMGAFGAAIAFLLSALGLAVTAGWHAGRAV